MRYVVEITDDDGQSCQIRLSVPFDVAGTEPENSTWRVLNEGFIKFRSGGCEAVGAQFESISLRLVRAGVYGVELKSFTSPILRTINDSGSGTIHQTWCVNLKPGTISWVVI